jgi:hypothetical protein
MAVPEFIYLNEQAVRVSSWRRDEDAGAIEFVVIAKGGQDRDQMLDILAREPVMVRIGTGSAIPMDVRSLDTRTTGEGPSAVHRFQVALWPEGSASKTTSSPAEQPTNPDDDRLDRIIALLTEIRDELRAFRP